MKPSHFFAYVSRMKLIDRWSLMRCTQRENVQEHSLQVAMIAHSLALIKNKFFLGDVPPDRVALCAIYHDSTEVLTGDLPTPIKYFSKEIRTAYLEIESHAVDQLVKLLPDELREDYRELLLVPERQSEIHRMIKAADTLSAYIKCLEEEAAGNQEFSRARKSIEAKVMGLCDQPEVEYFVKHFIPSFSLTLDEISQPFESTR
jgi:5'-deoxynucleotidase